MTAGLLLVVAAILIAPWQSAPARRLRDLEATPGAARGVRGGGVSGARGGGRGGRGGRIGGAEGAHQAFASAWRQLPPRWVSRLPGSPSTAGSGSLAWLLDLLAVALLAGLPAHLALVAVGDALEPSDPHAAAPLHAAASRIRLGATPAQAWREVPGSEQVAPVAPILARATDGGGSVRAALGHAAQRMRSDADAEALTRAERAAVLVAGPLGLCFLPAFVCLGIVPVVIGLADGMLPGILP